MSYPKFDVGDSAGDPKAGAQPGGYYPPPPAQGHGCFFWGCIISLIVSGVGLLLVVGGLALLWNFANSKIKEFTETAPVAIPKVTATDAQQKAIKERWAAFKKAVEEGKEAELVLNADDLNLLVQQEPRWKGKVFFTIKGDEMTAQVSYPLAEFKNPLFNLEGRYLNGTATITAEVDEDGQLDVRLHEMEVKGKKLPPDVKAQLGGENLGRDFSRNPENRQMLRRLRSIKVKNDKITLRSRAKDEQDATDKARATGIDARVAKIVSEQFAVPVEKVTPTASFKLLGADDQDLNDLFMELAEEFDMEFPDDAATRLLNARQVVDYIKAQQGMTTEKKPEPPAAKTPAPAPTPAKEPVQEKGKEKAKVPAGSTSAVRPRIEHPRRVA